MHSMLHVTIENESRVVLLEPDAPLNADDFTSAARIIDPLVEEPGGLNGMIIHTRSFPGWDSFEGLLSHLRFVRDHHQYISRVAIVTDSVIGNFAETVASHFVNAEVRHFPFAALNEARRWAAD
ncbi:MAG: STAS/SEC14 domain-containing protein [bacterium]